MDHVVVVGASLAGIHAAQTLRRDGFGGTITMVGDEPHLPYDRPPLSKHYLAGEWDDDKLRLRAAADPDALDLTWRLATRATGLDVGARSVAVEGPEGADSIDYDGLVIATGARPRRLPADELGGVFVLRSLDDAAALRSAFDAEPTSVVVIGAGFIGAEVAATARERGLAVTMIEAAEAPLQRVLDPACGCAVADLHRDHGVDVRLATSVAGFAADGGRVRAVELRDGGEIPADVVVVGIGVVPNTEWLEGSGLELDDGVVCDATCLAADGVVAAGDVARWPNERFGGRSTRVEQWDNAVDQGAYVARRLLAWDAGDPVEPFTPVPWFWSDQYDRKMQLAGVVGPDTEMAQGSIEERRFVQLFADGGRFVGAFTWNRPRQAIQARQLLTAGASLDEARETLGPPPG